jgi:hypothetical protein
MSIGEAQPASRQSINVWDVDQAALTAVTVYVTNSEIVSEDENDVRLRSSSSRREVAKDYGDDTDANSHAGVLVNDQLAKWPKFTFAFLAQT